MPGAVMKALGRSWLLTATGLMQIAILFPAIWFAAEFSITAVAASQVAAQTLSLALLGVVIGRLLDLPWYAAFTAGAPALALSAVMAGAVYPLTLALPPAAALAVGLPLSALLYLLGLKLFMPQTLDTLVRPLRDLVHRPATAATASRGTPSERPQEPAARAG
jgi:hypothetical protein